MKLEKLALKKQVCYFFVCKKCKQECEEGDFTPHFRTQKEAYEHLDDESGEDYLYGCDCWKVK